MYQVRSVDTSDISRVACASYTSLAPSFVQRYHHTVYTGADVVFHVWNPPTTTYIVYTVLYEAANIVKENCVHTVSVAGYQPRWPAGGQRTYVGVVPSYYNRTIHYLET